MKHVLPAFLGHHRHHHRGANMKHVLAAYLVVYDEHGAIIHTGNSGEEVPQSVMDRAKTVTTIVVKTVLDSHGEVVSAKLL